MREYKLHDPLHPEGGVIIKVKYDSDCVFCKHCSDISKRPCKYFEEGGEK